MENCNSVISLNSHTENRTFFIITDKKNRLANIRNSPYISKSFRTCLMSKNRMTNWDRFSRKHPFSDHYRDYCNKTWPFNPRQDGPSRESNLFYILQVSGEYISCPNLYKEEVLFVNIYVHHFRTIPKHSIDILTVIDTMLQSRDRY